MAGLEALARHVRIKPANERTAAAKAKANADHKKSLKKLRALCKLPGNDVCADCTAVRPGWAALPHGVHICINCAQIHRHIGRHISQVRGELGCGESTLLVQKAAKTILHMSRHFRPDGTAT